MDGMPDPCDDADAWMYIMVHFQYEWTCLVKRFVIFESPSGAQAIKQRREASLREATVHLTCNLCGDVSPIFATRKGLDAHLRTKHKQRTCVSEYIDDSGVCPCCKVNFYSRVRVLRHVSETRCRDKEKYKTYEKGS